MKNWYKYSVLLFVMATYFLVWLALQPIMGYMLDNDCVGYLTIAHRVATGDYFRSVNGLWSPLNSWLLVLFIKSGYNAWESAKVLNGFIGGLVIILTHYLCIHFNLKKWSYTILMCTLPIVVGYFSYFQLFGDLLQVAILLMYLLVLWSNNSIITLSKTILCGILVAIGFYAKAYTFIFFILHFGITLFWLFKKGKLHAKSAFVNYALGIVTVILCMLPWTFALHKKYNEWSLTGHAGKLNMSWNINSGKSFKPDINLLIPPSYNDSPSFWEDPYLSQQNLSTPFSSAHHFVKWIARVLHTCLVALTCLNELSFFALALLLIGFYIFFIKRKKEEVLSQNTLQMQLLTITMLVLPLGYLSMHIETRYIWLNTFLLMVFGMLIIESVQHYLKPLYYKLALLCFASSFLLFPMLQFQNLKQKNKIYFDYAQRLNQHNIQGRFTSNATDAGIMWLMAYLTKSQFYTIERTDYSEQELKQELKRYDIQYYVYVSENNKSPILIDTNTFKPLLKLNGLDVFEVKRVE